MDKNIPFPNLSASTTEILQPYDIELFLDVDGNKYEWYKGKISSDVKKQVVTHDGEEIEIEIITFVFDDGDENSVSFLEDHIAIFDFQENDSIEDVFFCWYRKAGEKWEPSEPDTNEYLHMNMKPDLNSEQEVSEFLDDILSQCLESETLAPKMKNLKRDELNYISDVINMGKQKLCNQIYSFLMQKRVDNPMYELSDSDFVMLLQSTSSPLVS